MKVFKRSLILVLALCFTFSLFPKSALGAWWRPRHAKPARRAPKPAPAKVKAKKYRYIKAHDLNNDGRVDNKDRLLWLQKNKATFVPVVVSADNEDMFEVMDMDGNGKVSMSEVKFFYNKYDTNRNGTLEAVEIENVAD